MTYKNLQESFLDRFYNILGERENLATFWIALFYVKGWSRLQFELNKNSHLSGNEEMLFAEISTRLQAGEPIQYITGTTEFYKNTHFVNPSVLIPRPETEELVDWIISDQQFKPDLKCMDIGTGSGCIINSLALNLKGSFTGVDVSESALTVAKRNGDALESNVVFKIVDILKSVTRGEGFDVIVSNPPYIPFKDKVEMKRNVLDFEPDLALFVPDEDPLLFYKSIIEFSKRNLSKDGVLYFEIHEGYEDRLKVMIQEKNSRFEFRKDMQGKTRMLKIWDLV